MPGKEKQFMGFGFASDAAEREYKALPEEIQDDFGKALRFVQHHEQPPLPVEPLKNSWCGCD